MREAINLGKPEKIGDKIRYKRMVKGNLWKSSLYDVDSRRNQSDAWQQFQLWRDDLEQQMKASRTPEQSALHDSVDLIDRDADFADMVENPKLAANRRKLADLIRVLIADDPSTAKQALQEVMGRGGEKMAMRVTAATINKSRRDDLAVSKIAEDFLTTHRSRAKAAEITAGRYGKIRAGVNRFVAWFGSGRNLATINENDVREYYAHLLTLKEQGENSNTLADDFGMFRQFIDEVSDDNPEIPKPQNLRSKKFTIGRTRREANPFTKDEFRLIYDNASEQTQLYLLLMLNCAMYQGDIADLTADEVDWEQGRIIRARSKKVKIMRRKNPNNEPIRINYKLWPETFKLLKKIGHREGLVVRNEDGGPVVVSKIGANGMETRNDNVRSAFSRVVAKLKKRKLLAKDWNKELKQLRKTGPNLLADKAEEYAEFIEVMLDHTSVSNRSYLKSGKPYKPFDEALQFIGKQFGF